MDRENPRVGDGVAIAVLSEVSESLAFSLGRTPCGTYAAAARISDDVGVGGVVSCSGAGFLIAALSCAVG